MNNWGRFFILAILVKVKEVTPVAPSKTFIGNGVAVDTGVPAYVQQTFDNGYIIVGTTATSMGDTNKDIYLLKTTSTGTAVWEKTFGGSGSDWGNSVQQTTDGGFIIAADLDILGSYGAYLIKTDSAGNSVWTKTFTGSSYGWGNSVRQTSDGGYIIVGSTQDRNTYLMKTDSFGNTVWTETYTGSCFYVQQTSDGGYIMVGYAYPGTSGGGDVYLIKTDGNGNPLW